MRHFKQIIIPFLYFIKYLLFLAIAILILLAIFLSNVYSDFRQATTNALAGKENLTIAISASQEKNWTLALSKSKQAREDFNKALENIDDSRRNLLIRNQGILRDQVNDIEYLLKTAEILSRSLEHTIPMAQELDKILSGAVGNNFSSLSSREKAYFISLIYESEPELNGLKANLELALLNLEKIHKVGVLMPIYSKISEFKYQLNQAIDLMDKITPLSQLLPTLSGYPELSRFLILLQNNDELRPSGGFIGLFGLLETKNGEIIYLKTSDSYYLDMPAVGKWQKEPPLPIKKYLKVKNWYLRDANWSPDWPTSAQKIQEIYNGETLAIGQIPPSFTGVIAINPDFVADLINLVGPITVADETYTPDNFQELLQYNVEVAYKEQDISSWDRKEIINDLITELKKKLFKLPANRWKDLLTVLDNNIISKNIQVYLTDSNLQNLAQSLGVTGEVKETKGDYLMIVDANLGAFKSDAVIKKRASYFVQEEGNDLVATIKLNYRHEGNFDWRTTRYRSYTRIYTPLGSELISLNGLKGKNPDFDSSDDISLDKTVIGFFWTIEPGYNEEVIIKYKLPKKIITAVGKDSYYNLYWQKQAGNHLEVSFDLEIEDDYELNWNGDLSSDKFFRLNLQSR